MKPQNISDVFLDDIKPATIAEVDRTGPKSRQEGNASIPERPRTPRGGRKCNTIDMVPKTKLKVAYVTSETKKELRLIKYQMANLSEGGDLLTDDMIISVALKLYIKRNGLNIK